MENKTLKHNLSEFGCNVCFRKNGNCRDCGMKNNPEKTCIIEMFMQVLIKKEKENK